MVFGSLEMCLRLKVLILCMMASATFAQQPSVRLRGGAPMPAGSVVSVDREGVVLRADQKEAVLSWDLVAEVRGDAKSKEFATVAESAWRARTRLERGDVVSAEPLFEVLASEYKNGTGATTRVVAEGLLRCRLHRGVQAGAVEPWLMWVRATREGSMTPSMGVLEVPGAPPLIDATTGLCPGLPPIWMRLPAVEAFARGFGESTSLSSELEKQAKAPEKADAIRAMYVLAAAFESGLVGEVKGGVLPMRHVDPGVALVAQVVASRIGVVEVRREARRLLSERLTQRQPQWMEAWVRVGIGRSQLREGSAEEQLLGVAQMLQVPARLRGASPYLAGVALAGAAVYSAPANPVGAWNLKKELQDRLPGHPALDVEAVREIRPPGASSGAKGVTKEAT